MVYLLLFCILALTAWREYVMRGYILGIVQQTAPPPPLSITTNDAVRQAFRSCGLNVENAKPDFDLTSTGKLGEVVYFTAKYLGKPLHTVSDLHKLFGEG